MGEPLLFEDKFITGDCQASGLYRKNYLYCLARIHGANDFGACQTTPFLRSGQALMRNPNVGSLSRRQAANCNRKP